MLVGLVVALLVGTMSCCHAWDVTDVYVKVSQDDAGNFTTVATPEGYWIGENATWVRGMIRGEDGAGHSGPWPEGKIVRIGPFHEQDPTRNWDMFYGVPPLGYDAYYMHTAHFWGDPVSKIYVGTNFFTGQKMKDIVTLQYSTQVTYRAHNNEVPGYTLWGQPPMIELTTDSGASAQQRTFMYKPWGLTGMGQEAVQCRWQTWDCRASNGFWERINTSVASIGDWSYQLAYKSTEKKLAAPAVGDYTEGYISPPGVVFHNPSGTSFAVKLGAPRRDYDNYSGNTQYAGKGPWVLESVSTHAFFDKVVIGIADQRDGSGNVLHETRYTFDFENSTTPVPTLAAMNNAPRKLAIVKAMEDSNLFVLYGKVITTPDFLDNGYVANELFTIDDGSGAPVRVICPGHTIAEPDGFTTIFARVEGRLYNYQGEDSRYRYEVPIPKVHEHSIFSRPDLVDTFVVN